jgi:hypothetical protein
MDSIALWHRDHADTLTPLRTVCSLVTCALVRCASLALKANSTIVVPSTARFDNAASRGCLLLGRTRSEGSVGCSGKGSQDIPPPERGCPWQNGPPCTIPPPHGSGPRIITPRSGLPCLIAQRAARKSSGRLGALVIGSRRRPPVLCPPARVP